MYDRQPLTLPTGPTPQRKRSIDVVALCPWLMLPVVPVIVVELALNFFGDGLRDAADPYK